MDGKLSGTADLWSWLHGSDRALYDGIDECAGERLAGEPAAVEQRPEQRGGGRCWVGIRWQLSSGDRSPDDLVHGRGMVALDLGVKRCELGVAFGRIDD
jgi:hypothetical protein